jgi:deoxycytidylate deaminase
MKFSLAQHKKYMSKAMKVAQQSDDPSTKVGCVIVDDKGKVISTGFNHYPKQAKKNSFPTKREYKNQNE